MKARAALVLSFIVSLGACAQLVGIGDLPGPSRDGGTKDSAGQDEPADAAGGSKDSSHDAPMHETAPYDAPGDVLDAGAPLHAFPSHTQPSYYEPEAGALTAITAIDTSALSLNGSTTLPSGVQFVLDDMAAHAVLSVGGWDVEADVVVTGGPPLIVVAAGAVTVDAVIDGAAEGATPGPGAITSTLSPAVGTAGCLSSIAGGQGGGFGTAGAFGGSYKPVCSMTGGQVFGALLTDFSGGGAGGAGDEVCGTGARSGAGGGGGGAIQISSAVSIDVISGGVNVGGGGGQGGCANSSGGGGGAGGEIFLEAPKITIAGTLAANGGGGGTGDDMGMGDAAPGSDGTLGKTPAAGGASTGDMSPGGAGAAGATPAASGVVSLGEPSGGGGGLGRIWFRTRGAAAMTSAGTLSGTQSHDTSL